MKPHIAHQFPGGRSQLFRRGMQEVLGLSEEFTKRSAYSAADAAKIRGLTTEQLDLVGQHMSKSSGIPLTVTRNPKQSYRSWQPKARPMDQVTLNPVRLNYGEATMGPGKSLSARLTYSHELLEFSEAVAGSGNLAIEHRSISILGYSRKRNAVRVGDEPSFGTHYSTTVISEESRLATALGEKPAQIRFRSAEYRAPANKYGAGLERMGQIDPKVLASEKAKHLSQLKEAAESKRLGNLKLKQERAEFDAFQARNREAKAKGLPTQSLAEFNKLQEARHLAKTSNPSAIQGIKPETRSTSPVKKHSGFGSPWDSARAAFVDVETLGLGSIVSKAGVEPGGAAYKKIIEKHGFEIAHQGLTSPPGIWEIGLSLPDDKGHPDSIFMKPDKITKMEVGAEKAARKAGTWDQFQKIINAADTPSEKAGIETALKQLEKSKVTQLAGWNIKNFDFPLLVERATELGVDSDLIKNFKKLQVVDIKETAEAILEGVFSKYKDKTGASIFGEVFDPASRSGVVDELGWQKGFMKQENISKLFGFEHRAHIAGGQYGDVAVLKQISGALDDLGGANGRQAATDALKTVNKNIVGYYGKIVDQLTEEGRLIGDARTTADQQLVHLREATKGISNAEGTGMLDLAERAGETTEMHTSASEVYEKIKPDDMPDGTKVMQAHEERMSLSRAAKTAKAPGGDNVIDIGKKIGRKFNEGLGKTVTQIIEGLSDNIPKAFEFVERNRVGVAIAAAVGAAAYLIQSRDQEKEFRGDYEGGLTSNIEAGMLGLSESEMKKAIMEAKTIRGLNSYLINRNKRVGKLNSLKEGEMIHREIQEALKEDVQFIGAEVPVVDHELGVKGLVDLVLEIGGEKTPVEIKTVEDRETLARLTGPKLSHMSQANFYSHVLGSKGAYIVYATREDKQARKVFYQPYSGGMLAADIHKFRSALISAIKEQPSLSIQWAHQMRTMNYEPGIPAGIRPEGPGGYEGFDIMSSFDNFGWPGAREQTYERPKSAILSSRGRSRIRDQGARNHFTGPGFPKTPMDGNDTVNASRYGSPIG